MFQLVDRLLSVPVDNARWLLEAVLLHCTAPSLLLLSRCSVRIKQALMRPLRDAEEESICKLLAYLGATREELFAAQALSWQGGLPSAQRRHLASWLRAGGPLAGITSLRLLTKKGEPATVSEEEDGEEEVDAIEIDLWQLRAGAATLDLSTLGMDDELLMVLALPMGSANLKELYLWRNDIGD